MSGLLRRRLAAPYALVASPALTGALLLLCAYVQPGASVYLWFLVGALACGLGGILAGNRGAILSALTTVVAVDYFAMAPVAAFTLPRTLPEILGLATFIVTAGVIARLSYLKDSARDQRLKADLAWQRVERDARSRRLVLRLSERALAGGRVDVLCRNAAEAVNEALDVPFCAVLESHANEDALAVTASSGWAAESVHDLKVQANVDSQVGYALFAREPIAVADADAEPRFQLPAEFRTLGARSGIAVRIGGTTSFGVLVAYDIAPRTFDDAAIEFVCGVATTLAAAYERTRLDSERAELVSRDGVRREEAQLTARRAAFLAHTASVLDAALDPETTLVSLARLAVPTIADCAIVDLVEEDGTVRRIDLVDIDPIRREDADALRRLSPDLRTEGPFPRAIRTGQPVLLPELGKIATRSPAEADHLRSFIRLGCQSLLLIPLVARGQTLGLLTLGSRVAYRYAGADLSLAQELAGRAAVALDNGRLHREAQAASRAKDEFLAMVSHELRTPLNAVLGWSAILRRQRTDEARSDQALDAIERSVHAQAQLLEQLLDVSRIVAGKFELRLAPIRLDEVIERAAEAVRPAAEERHVRVDRTIAPGVPALTADPDRLQQVVVNLLSNAIKFTPDQGVVEIDLRTADDATAEIVVRDYGVGIKREFLPYVFDRFRQSAGGHGVFNKGLGLGLSIVREIVERHGGKVVADSAGEGQGATFRVTLPLDAAAEGVVVGDSRRSREPLAQARKA